jgi:transcriptional regulator with XRE-family HTH domain
LSLILISLIKLDTAFGKTLRKRRLAKLLTQEVLATEANLSRAYISDLEMGKKDPSLFTVFKLADALKLKPSVLIDEVESTI